jgi:DNA-binding FadR family transcriptional regulator
MAFETARISRAEQLARHLEQEIVAGALPAGERLGTKEDLRKRSGFAVATVNEAVRLLETRGIVTARSGPGGGVFVAAPSSRVRLNHLVLGFEVGAAPFSDCLEVRNTLEPLVCREAWEHCTRADAKVLRGVIVRMEEEAVEPAAFLERNWELHRTLARMGRNAPLKTMYLTLLDFVQDGLTDVHGDDLFDPEENLRIHTELVEAIIGDDVERLRVAVDRHTPVADRWIQSPR